LRPADCLAAEIAKESRKKTYRQKIKALVSHLLRDRISTNQSTATTDRQTELHCESLELLAGDL